jgi:hypothetical protein
LGTKLKHKFDTLKEKQNILDAIKRIAVLLDKTPTQKEYKKFRTSNEMSLEQIFYRYSNWSSALLEAGLKPNPFQSPPRQPVITKDDLINEFILVSNKLSKIPGNHEFRVHSKYSWTPYKTNWGSFKNAVNFIIENYSNKFNFDILDSHKKNKKNKDKYNLLRYKCNMVYEPSNEYETIALFILLSEKMGYKIKHIQADFPDGVILNQFDEEFNVEFEYLSSNYIQHCHPYAFDGICICWRKDMELGSIKIISLEEYINS